MSPPTTGLMRGAVPLSGGDDAADGRVGPPRRSTAAAALLSVSPPPTGVRADVPFPLNRTGTLVAFIDIMQKTLSG